MALALKSGYSKTTIQTNMSVLGRAGYARNDCIKAAFNAARASYFKLHPQGALPAWLAYPHDKRLAKYYLPNGAPLRSVPVESNPVRELSISPDEMQEIRRDVQKQMTGQGAAVRKAARLYTDFTGHEDVRIGKVSIAPMPKAALAIGQVDGIMYSTVRDGLAEKYIHRFAKNSRPLLLAAPDGKQLYLLGGAYDFTERGIVDKKT